MSATQGVSESELDGPDYVRCEVCRLPHRRTAERCDRCDHALGSPVDWAALEQEIPGLRLQIAAGVLLFVLMEVINLAVFDGAGVIFLLAPIGWALFGTYRIHVLKSVLRHRTDDANPE
jgi:hypothetical protein